MLILSNLGFAMESSNQNKYLEGKIYKKGFDKEVVVDDVIKNMKISEDDTKIKGTLKSNKKTLKFTAELVKKKDGINSYSGSINTKNEKYNCEIVKNNNGLSILYYDNTRKFVRSIVLVNTANKLGKVEEEIRSKVEPTIKEKSKQTFEVESENSFQLFSNPINQTHHIFKDSVGIPFLLEGGTVEGWFKYQINVDPSMAFYATELEGVINWSSGFDSISITNVDEVYGIFWGTPSCPSRNLQTWNINKAAENDSQYYIDATVSYTLLVQGFPVLYWDTDTEYLNY